MGGTASENTPDNDGFRWAQFSLSRDGLASIPSEPGLVRTPADAAMGRELVVTDLRAWLRAARGDLIDVALTQGQEPEIDWCSPPPRDLEAWILKRTGGLKKLKPGRPRIVRSEKDLAAVPDDWGLYRIHRTTDDTWYVGISSNVRVRLQTHRRNGMFDLSQRDEIEVILTRSPSTGHITTWAALQEAEKQHISRLQERGAKVINITGGGNGHPPNRRFNARTDDQLTSLGRSVTSPRGARAQLWYHVDAEERRIPGSDFLRVALDVVWMDQDRDWRLHLDRDGYIAAEARGDGPVHEVKNPLTVTKHWICQEYARRHPGRDLEADLETAGEGWTLADDCIVRFFVHKRESIDDVGLGRVNMEDLRAIDPEHLATGRLPKEVTELGYHVDPEFRLHNNLNTTVRLLHGEDLPVYLKAEENKAAVRAEKLVSLLWHRLAWRGLGGRVTETDGGALLIPALGGAGVVDRGPFKTYFHLLPMESPLTLHTPRARRIKRVELADLALRNRLDVAAFVLVNAITGNSDRHSGNLHMGIDPDGRPGANGFLLPIDHGRCLFNNDMGRPRTMIVGTPTDAVTGQVGNPHQLLRPFSQLVATERSDARDTALDTVDRVGRELDALASDPAWADYRPEIDDMLDRCAWLQDRIDEFIDDCCAVVLS